MRSSVLKLLLAFIVLAAHCVPHALAIMNPGPNFSTNLLAINQCSRWPATKLSKHPAVSCGDGDYNPFQVIHVNPNHSPLQSVCAGSQGPACAQLGSQQNPFTSLDDAIAEALHTGQALLLYADYPENVVFPAGLRIYGRNSPTVQKYLPELHDDSNPTTLSGRVHVVAAGGNGVGGEPTMFSGIQFAERVLLSGHFGAGLWFIACELQSSSGLMSNEQGFVSGHVVITRSVVNADQAVFINQQQWKASANTTLSITVDCNLIGSSGQLTDVRFDGEEAAVVLDVHDNVIQNTPDINVRGAGQLSQRISRNYFSSSSPLNVGASEVKDAVLLFGSNYVRSGVSQYHTSETLQSSLYGNLITGLFNQQLNAVDGTEDMVVNVHDNVMPGGAQFQVHSFFNPSPSYADPARTLQTSVSVRRNQWINRQPLNPVDFVLLDRFASSQQPLNAMLHTESNLVRATINTYRLASIQARGNFGWGHLSAVRSLGDFLSSASGVAIQHDTSGPPVGSTYSLEVSHLIGLNVDVGGELSVNDDDTGYNMYTTLNAHNNYVIQQSSSSAAFSALLPQTLEGGQTSIDVSYNTILRENSKKKRNTLALRPKQICKMYPDQEERIIGPIGEPVCGTTVTETYSATCTNTETGGGKKRSATRSFSIPTTVPWLGGRTFSRNAHHSWSFNSNLVKADASSSSLFLDLSHEFNMSPFSGPQTTVTPGSTLTVEFHADQNVLETTVGGGGAQVIYVDLSGTMREFGGAVVSSSVDHNMFLRSSAASPDQVAAEVSMSNGFHDQRDVSISHSVSYNLLENVDQNSQSVLVTDTSDIELDGSGSVDVSDVFRLNYDCQLRGNVFNGTFVSLARMNPLMQHTANVNFMYNQNWPTQVSQLLSVDDNYFSSNANSGAEYLIRSESNVNSLSSYLESQSSSFVDVSISGNAIAEPGAAPATSSGMVFSSHDVGSVASAVHEHGSRVVIQNNRVPDNVFTGSAIAQSSNFANGGSTFRSTLNSVTIKDNEMHAGTSPVISSASQNSNQNMMGDILVSNNRILCGSVDSVGSAIYAGGAFDQIQIENNQLLGIDSGSPTVGNLVLVGAAGYTTTRDSSISIDNNFAKRVDVTDATIRVFSTQAVGTDIVDFDFTNNRARDSTGSAGSLQVFTNDAFCATFSGNHFTNSPNADNVVIAGSGSMVFDQAAGDQMDLSGFTSNMGPCP